MVLSVAALMAAMMVASAGPVFAQATVFHNCTFHIPTSGEVCSHSTSNKNEQNVTGQIKPGDNPENTGGGAEVFGENENCGDFCGKSVVTPSGNSVGHIHNHPQGK